MIVRLTVGSLNLPRDIAALQFSPLTPSTQPWAQVIREPEWVGGGTRTYPEAVALPMNIHRYKPSTFPWRRLTAVLLQSARGAAANPIACRHCQLSLGPFDVCRRLRNDEGELQLGGACANCIYHSIDCVGSFEE